MHSEMESSKAQDQTVETERARNRHAWERPSLRRLDAADAESGRGANVEGRATGS